MFESVQKLLEQIWSRPILALITALLPFVFAGGWRKCFPTAALVALFAIPTLTTLLLIQKSDILPLVVALDLAVVAAAAVDLFLVAHRSDFRVERQCQKIVSLEKTHHVTLTITYTGRRTCILWVRDDVPQEFYAQPEEFTLRMTPRSRAHVKYDLIAGRRGAFRLERVYLRVRSRFGLWKRYLSLNLEQQLHVYPDMQQLSKYAILARTNRLSLIGVRRTRKIGTDNEFERLRDYTLDDSYRNIDWRATARRSKLTVKDFQASQSQRLIFLIDCGRMMTNLASGLSLLDHSLNAMLMLSYVALQKGDSVGMIAFSERVHAFVPPKGGMNQMNQLLHASFDRFPALVESRYDEAFFYLSAHCQKRALVILVTNVIDEVNANQIHQYLSSISGRHLALGVLLRDHRLFQAAEAPFPSGEDLYCSAAAADILSWRQHVITTLQHNGALALDVFPEDMTAPLVNQYLEIKARHLL